MFLICLEMVFGATQFVLGRKRLKKVENGRKETEINVKSGLLICLSTLAVIA